MSGMDNWKKVFRSEAEQKEIEQRFQDLKIAQALTVRERTAYLPWLLTDSLTQHALPTPALRMTSVQTLMRLAAGLSYVLPVS